MAMGGRLAAWAATAAVTLGAAACSAAGDAPADGDSATTLEQIYDRAAEADASPAQLAVLERAVATQQVTFDDVSAAVDALAACVEAAGFALTRDDRVAASGLREVSYAVTGGDPAAPDEGQRILDSCRLQHSEFVEEAYLSQPSSVALLDAHIAEVRPEIVACLRDAGREVDDEATFSELIAMSGEVLTGLTAEQREAATSEDGVVEVFEPAGPDCMAPYVGD